MLKRLFALFVLLTMAACVAPAPPIVVPEPLPLPRTFSANVSIYDEAGAPVTDATCTLAHDVDADAGEAPIKETETGWRQLIAYTIPPVHDGWGATLTCSSPNYLTTAVRLEPLISGEQPNVRMKSAPTWGTEHGWLSTQGRNFIGEDGQPWRYRGYSAFKYLKQFCDGQDIGPLVDDAVSVGAHVFRTLGMYEGSLGSFRLAVDDPARFDQCALDYSHYMANRLLRVEFVVFADAQNVMPDTGRQQAWLAHIGEKLGGEWNVLGELCNECTQNGVDPTKFTKPATRILWSRGSDLGNQNPRWAAWDFITYHESRNDEWPSKNECRPISDEVQKPCVSDEPIGFAETARPGSRAGAVNGDAGAAISDAGQSGGVFSIGAAGGTCHTDAGVSGGLLGPVQRQMCAAFFFGLNFAPAGTQTGVYQRGANCGNCDGVGGMPVEQLDASEIRAYCRLVDGTEWCAVVRGTVRPRAGWRVVSQPFPGLLRLER